MQWDQLFETMENIKAERNGLIEEYSLQQTTLEEVFLSFARRQYSSEREVKANCFSKMLSFLFGC
jgi:hypothetical protein